MLTYMEIHLYYTLPVVWILLYILKPFYSKQDQVKYVFLCSVAFFTAAPWDNYIVFHRAWWYCPRCVTLVIGYVPLEEYMFFIVMTMMTVSFSNLVMRWHLPALHLKPIYGPFQSMLIRYIPIITLLSVAVEAWTVAIPDTPLFYSACILWYTCPVLALLWFGASNYICHRWKEVLISVILPTFYLCWVDNIAISAGTWHISERTSTQIMLISHLPVEEALFFLMINIVLVFATCAMDRSFAILHLYQVEGIKREGQHQASSDLLTTMAALVKAFTLSEQSLDPQPLDDLCTTWNILKKASTSFYTASTVFPTIPRQDLGILYGFCRATDDLADNEALPVEQRQQQLGLVRDFVLDMFTQKSNCASQMNWHPYVNRLPEDCLACLRSFVRLRHMLQVDAVLELLEGYTWDLEGRPIENEKDLIRYSECVASSVGEMCTRVLIHNSRNNDDHYCQQDATFAWTVRRARDMGLALQFTNIARDIVTDSQQLQRCYLPATWLNKDELTIIQQGRARQLGDQRLKQLSLRLVCAADGMNIRAHRGISKLPKDCQGGVRAACGVYCAIGQALKEADHYPTRAHVKGFKRAWIALQNVYDMANHRQCL